MRTALVLLGLCCGCGGNVVASAAGGGAGGTTTTGGTTTSTGTTVTTSTTATTTTTTTTTTTSTTTTTTSAPPITGSACVAPEDCGPGYDCFPAPGGYCVVGSPSSPTTCFPDGGEDVCPEGTVCAPLPWSQMPGLCMRACATPADCRPNQVCAKLQTFPGDPSSPTSAAPVCWTACTPGMNPSCNDNPVISSIHGECQEDGTCLCYDGFAKNPETGRCL